MSGRGCSYCNGTGYHGRMGVYEMLEMNRTLAEAAAHDSSVHFMKAAREHMRGKSILDHAMEMLQQGRTSVPEVMRVSNQVED
jgi:MSHA biogenesis protein MshE